MVVPPAGSVVAAEDEDARVKVVRRTKQGRRIRTTVTVTRC